MSFLTDARVVDTDANATRAEGAESDL